MFDLFWVYVGGYLFKWYELKFDFRFLKELFLKRYYSKLLIGKIEEYENAKISIIVTKAKTKE